MHGPPQQPLGGYNLRSASHKDLQLSQHFLSTAVHSLGNESFSVELDQPGE